MHEWIHGAEDMLDSGYEGLDYDTLNDTISEHKVKANIIVFTVELWSLDLACLEHQGSLELVRLSRQFPYTFNVRIHPRLEQRWLELKARSAGQFFM